MLEKETYRAGEQVKGYFLIKGGTILQQLKRIDCDLVLMDREEKNEEIVDSVTILTTKCIQADAIFSGYRTLPEYRQPHYLIDLKQD
ncbi:sporulation protein [Cytobacillus oceanisediminis]|uniref:sporulation protein n=1 Tax=Bacillaceae TaxID=186817 RepID=UPI001E4B8FC4|nr:MULTISPECIES: sporulation protein [Bacillus]MCM3405376.1 sporulation protein [Cytobacillus oceanisediminis]